MKKVLLSIMTIILSLTLCGCGKEKIVTKECSLIQNGMITKVNMTASNDKINKFEMTVVLKSSTLNINSFKELNEATKEQIKENFLTTLKLTKQYEGIEVDVSFEENMSVIIKVDIEKADIKKLKELGFDITSTNMSLEKTVKDAQKDGYVCQ